MAYKQLTVGSAAREKILRGATALADAVRVTLGPKSKSVLLQKKWGKPIVCNDGVTIAKEIELKDPEENLGAQMLREAAERTGEAVGDGTTTSDRSRNDGRLLPSDFSGRHLRLRARLQISTNGHISISVVESR